MKIYHGHWGRVIVFKVLSGCWEQFLSQTIIAPKFQKDLIIVRTPWFKQVQFYLYFFILLDEPYWFSGKTVTKTNEVYSFPYPVAVLAVFVFYVFPLSWRVPTFSHSLAYTCPRYQICGWQTSHNVRAGVHRCRTLFQDSSIRLPAFALTIFSRVESVLLFLVMSSR